MPNCRAGPAVSGVVRRFGHHSVVTPREESLEQPRVTAGPSAPRRVELEGHIGAAGFASGDRVVVGAWTAGPLGPMVDLMWARPDGERVLLAPTTAVADFVTSLYVFDRIEVVTIDGRFDGRALAVDAGPLSICLVAGRGWPFPPAALRPTWCTRFVEGPIARAVMGVRTYGVTPTGVREWYRADRWSPVVSGTATLDGVDLGPSGPVDPPCRFGFSEPPRRASITAVRPLLEFP